MIWDWAVRDWERISAWVRVASFFCMEARRAFLASRVEVDILWSGVLRVRGGVMMGGKKACGGVED